MRYKPEHKERTRNRIVAVAGRLFRRQGYWGVGIDVIMAAAKLTRGGFYSHFRSKEDLFALVLRGEHDFNRRMAARPGRTRAELAAQGLDVVAGYLDPDNRHRVGQGCTMASLSIDVARAGTAARAAYCDHVNALEREFARGLNNSSTPDPRAMVSIAICVGGLVVARAMNDRRLARFMLTACREAVADQFTRLNR